MKNSHKLLAIIILTALFGCNQKSDLLSLNMAGEVSPDLIESERIEPVETIAPINRKLIKTGWIEFETNSIKYSREKVVQAVTKHRGYISSDREYSSTGRNSNTIMVRVPADSFDDFLKDATEGIERFDSKSINVSDVTEEFLDVKARVKTKKEIEARFHELLKQARTISDILEIEKQIGQLRTEIESIEGRLKYLENQVSYSTLTITFYERIPTKTEFGKMFKMGLRNGWNALIWLFVLLTNIWPFIIIGLGVVFGIRFYRKKFHKQTTN